MVWSLFSRRPQDPLLERLGLKRKDVSPAARAVLETVVDENDSLRAQLKDAQALADRDPSLPALNRRAFLREVGRSASYVERYRDQAAVIFIDLNGFKKLNDTYGHAAGDAVLKHIARVIGQSIRDSDRFGRMGGDEFAVLLNHVTPAEAHAKAASLARLIAERPCTYAGVTHAITASIGAHPFSWDDQTITLDPELLLARADEAMYAAKHAARADSVANS